METPIGAAILQEVTQFPLWLAVPAAYLLGGIPFGFLMARAKGIDLRAIGSGNIGATNTMRAIGRPLGVLAFVLDFGKGWVSVFVIASLTGRDDPSLAAVLCGAAAVVGHCFPVYLSFKGGKGVATACGAIVAFDPVVFLAGGVVWLVTALGTRFVGLASILMGLAFPVAAWLRHPDDATFIAGTGLLTLLIVVRHRANIKRMIEGTELRMGARKKA